MVNLVDSMMENNICSNILQIMDSWRGLKIANMQRRITEKLSLLCNLVSLSVQKTPLLLKTLFQHFTRLGIDDIIDYIPCDTLPSAMYPWRGLKTAII